MGEMTLADIAAVTDRDNNAFGGNNGGMWIFALLILLMMGGGYWNKGNQNGGGYCNPGNIRNHSELLHKTSIYTNHCY